MADGGIRIKNFETKFCEANLKFCFEVSKQNVTPSGFEFGLALYSYNPVSPLGLKTNFEF